MPSTLRTSAPPAPRVGARVRLVRCTDEWTHLAPGALGTIEFIDSTGTLHMRWDSGSTLGLIPGIDAWEVVS